jgi:hypothetical protein
MPHSGMAASQQSVCTAPFPGADAFTYDGRLPVLVGGDGPRHAGVHREGVTEPGHPDDLQDRAGAGHQGERPAAGAKLVAAAHQRAQAGRVQETALRRSAMMCTVP